MSAQRASPLSFTSIRELEPEQSLSAPGEGDEMMDQEEQVEGEVEGYASSTPTSSLTWITWFCSLPGHEYFCEVSEEFIEDDFNLTGLNSMVPFWKEALEMVLDVEPEDTLKIPDVSIVEASAELLYGLVHQRYILTRAGLQAMVEKYEAGQFGTCPRVYCVASHVVPCGRSDLPGLDTVKLYCPNCHDIYIPPSSRFQGVDGAFFGTTFAHLFFQTYRELAPAPYVSPNLPSTSTSPASGSKSNSRHGSDGLGLYDGHRQPASKIYIPKIYGFKVSERARSGPRMQWLRMRPETAAELDTVDWRGRWIGSDDEYDDAADPGREPSRPPEEFDPDQGDDDDDEEDDDDDDEGGQGELGDLPGQMIQVQRFGAERRILQHTEIRSIAFPMQSGGGEAGGKVKVAQLAKAIKV